MKKLLSFAATALALCGLMVSCASSGSSEKSGAPASIHPRSYTFDLIDGGSDTINLVWNQYGPNYQATPFFDKLVKTDKVQAGDTVTFKAKATTDVDLPLLLAYPVSTSPNWTPMGETIAVAENVKAGETFEIDVTFVTTAKQGTNFALCMQYDNADQEVKTGGPCVLTLERVCESTDTSNEVPAAPHVSHMEIELEKVAAFFEIATNHPWVNGSQDMSVISNYQGVCDLMSKYNADDLPKAGDTLKITWKAASDVDISAIHMRIIDNSPAANWWTELDANGGGGAVFIENVVAGEPFEGEMEMTFERDAIGGVALCIWYDIGDANPDGPAIIKLVRN